MARAWEGLELRRQPEEIAGELELGDGGPRPARPGYNFLQDRGVCVRSGRCSRRLGRALFIAERRVGIGLRRRTPGHGARRRTALVSEGEGDAAHAGTLGERRRDENRSEGVATNTVRSALLRWPDRARAHCGELRHRRVPGQS